MPTGVHLKKKSKKKKVMFAPSGLMGGTVGGRSVAIDDQGMGCCTCRHRHRHRPSAGFSFNPSIGGASTTPSPALAPCLEQCVYHSFSSCAMDCSREPNYNARLCYRQLRQCTDFSLSIDWPCPAGPPSCSCRGTAFPVGLPACLFLDTCMRAYSPRPAVRSIDPYPRPVFLFHGSRSTKDSKTWSVGSIDVQYIQIQVSVCHMDGWHGRRVRIHTC